VSDCCLHLLLPVSLQPASGWTGLSCCLARHGWACTLPHCAPVRGVRGSSRGPSSACEITRCARPGCSAAGHMPLTGGQQTAWAGTVLPGSGMDGGCQRATGAGKLCSQHCAQRRDAAEADACARLTVIRAPACVHGRTALRAAACVGGSGTLATNNARGSAARPTGRRPRPVAQSLACDSTHCGQTRG